MALSHQIRHPRSLPNANCAMQHNWLMGSQQTTHEIYPRKSEHDWYIFSIILLNILQCDYSSHTLISQTTNMPQTNGTEKNSWDTHRYREKLYESYTQRRNWMSTQGRMKSMNYTDVKNWMRKLCGKKPNDIIHWFGEKPWHTHRWEKLNEQKLMKETEWVNTNQSIWMSIEERNWMWCTMIHGEKPN